MGQVRQRVAQVHHLGVQGLLAREGEQLLDQRGRAVRVLLDLVEVGVFGVGLVAPQHQQVAMAGDRGQQVVEVVGDAARQLADRLHLLALDELFLERLHGAGVGQDGHDARPRLAQPGGGQHDLKELFGFVADEPQNLAPGRRATLRHIRDPVADRAARPLDDLSQRTTGRGVAQQRAGPFIRIHDRAVGVEPQQRHGKVGRQDPLIAGGAALGRGRGRCGVAARVRAGV